MRLIKGLLLCGIACLVGCAVEFQSFEPAYPYEGPYLRCPDPYLDPLGYQMCLNAAHGAYGDTGGVVFIEARTPYYLDILSRRRYHSMDAWYYGRPRYRESYRERFHRRIGERRERHYAPQAQPYAPVRVYQPPAPRTRQIIPPPPVGQTAYRTQAVAPPRPYRPQAVAPPAYRVPTAGRVVIPPPPAGSVQPTYRQRR